MVKKYINLMGSRDLARKAPASPRHEERKEMHKVGKKGRGKGGETGLAPGTAQASTLPGLFNKLGSVTA